MPSIDVVIQLSTDECLRHYRGEAQNVYATSVDGRRVLFPARALRRILRRDGVNGVFRLTFTEDGRFESIIALPMRSG
ncbi:DUF2835 domain-containing protein [Halomonas sp. McH1-25]|uniref:DUF2835 family protein n=1 Tax=unclassified Halomonas TaxID=2609666 RepID=UPI001EF68227|nr:MULTISPECIES: DUF2835 family protein [unclassified Halomonas]MCG7598626.1 DUF2835 domain-containing protein [Halomonas sp. McH1-25]MCP1342322.1 DUF2835 domain-containing protein [Halomonas sp. FL8]MCP1360657.1 DUF2835 domain-containing protein [Halomonas sp. BBD45]MCP1366392.1 DUF2835 domain-containing protein [Halomonas sp. BBD48]